MVTDSNQRWIPYLNTIHNFAIFFVVLVHCSPSAAARPALQLAMFKIPISFLMPLFVVVSGLLYYHTSVDRHQLYGKFMLGKAKRLLLPYLVVSTAAFIPDMWNDVGVVEVDNTGTYLVNQTTNSEAFVAPVQLPHGAVVTGLTFGHKDLSDATGSLVLRRRSMADVTLSADTLAQVDSEGTAASPFEGTLTDVTIDNGTVDNASYTYFLRLTLPPDTGIQLYGVIVAYEVATPY